MDTANNSDDRVIGIFRPGLSSEGRISLTTVGRQDLLEDLLGSLKKQADKTKKQHFVFVGPRGIGKTHFLKLIEISIAQNSVLQQHYQIISFPEENYRILSFADFLLGIIEILSDETADPKLQDLFEKLEEEEDDTAIIDTVIPYFKNYKHQTGKNLLVLLENLDMIFKEQLKLKKNEKSVHQFRKFLMETPCVNFIGTSPVHFEGFDNADHPLYDFFDIQLLEDFTEKQTIELIKKNLEWDNQKKLLDTFSQMVPKILALHKMTGGNARLIMMLYNLIAEDNILEAKKQFEILLDRISPFYQDRIKGLAPQERAILETMALMRKEFKTPAKVALKMRKSQQQVSSLLKRMLKSGYLTVSNHPDDRRSKVYRIKEGFFDLWLAMSQSRLQRKRLPYLVDFFAGWFAQIDEREKKRQELWDMIEKDKTKKANNLDLLGYLSEVGTDEEKAKAKYEQASYNLKQENKNIADSFLTEAHDLQAKNPVLAWMKDETQNWITDNDTDPDMVEQMHRMVDFWRFQRAGDFEARAALAIELGTGFSQKGLHELNIAFLEKELPAIKDPVQQSKALKGIAHSQMSLWALPDAKNTLDKALDIFQLNNDNPEYNEIVKLIGKIYYLTGEYETALKHLEKSLKISQEIGDRSGEGTTRNNIGQIYYSWGDYAEALKYFEASLKISQEIGDEKVSGTSLNNIGQIYDFQGDYKTALKYLEKSLKISQRVGDRSGEAMTLNNISQIYKIRGDYETTLQYLEESLKISQEIGDKSCEGTTLNNMSSVSYVKGDYETARKYLEESLRISQEIGDRHGESTNLNNLGQLNNFLGDHETASNYLKRSLKISQEIGDRRGEGTTLNNIGLLNNFLGNYETALKHLKKSLKISQIIGDKSTESSTLNNISQIYNSRGDYKTALNYLGKSLKVSQEVGDKRIEGTTLNNISQVYDAQGDYETALKYLDKSLKISQEIGDKCGESVTLNNISGIAYEKKDFETALKYLEESLKISQEIEDKRSESNTLNNISQIYDTQSEYETALKYMEKSLNISQEIGDKRGMIPTLHNMSKISLNNKKHKAAYAYAEKAYSLAVETENALGIFHVGQHLGRLLCDAGEKDKGIELLKKSFAIGKKARIAGYDKIIPIIEQYES